MTDRIPAADHVSRYCGFSKIENDEVDGAAFMLRKDEKSLSVNWLEYFGKRSTENNIERIRESLISKGRTLGAKAVFAVLNVGETLEHVQRELEKSLEVIHEPEPKDPSHAGIHGYTWEDDIVADLIAEVIRDTYPARSP